MKINKNEERLLIIFILLLLSLGYYFFVFEKQKNRSEELKVQALEEKRKYDEAMTKISSLERKEGQLKVLNSNISIVTDKYYRELVEENIIVQLNKFIEDTKFNGKVVTFNPIDVVEMEYPMATVKNPDSTLKEFADSYKLGKEIDSSVTGDTTANISTDNSEVPKKSTDIKMKKTVATVEQMKFVVEFSESSLDSTLDFLKAIEENGKKIVIRNIDIKESSGNIISGTINLEIYVMPSLENEKEENLVNDNNGGVDVAFNTSSVIEDKKESNDFIMMLKPYKSSFPTVVLGKGNDNGSTSYINSTNNKEENVELVLKEDGGKYYCKYKVGNNSYPVAYDGNGIEFTPSGDEIRFKILSSSRIDDDKASVKIKLVNNTNKTVKVTIEEDDHKNPRVNIDSEGSVDVDKK
ncbi:Hypothetical protein CM240_0541 [Clostridium bornimense]|uniref:Type IV pilus assembly protein PilO n=1 Tax=Clostridium bornimense TaxID=1216932 RepID=W6RSW7_9CLOT|nr:hypothetical protein [Clostridium bornimense]CDM67706.1 Hypothetical protein CM240_0541 [Clostridium bornimense]